jgi:uncharacterized membrane protein YhaH (DUF805 family)
MYMPPEWGVTFVVMTILLASVFLVALPLWLLARILHKAGYSAWWGLLGLLPTVNIVMLWVFAYAQWPALAGEDSAPRRQ